MDFVAITGAFVDEDGAEVEGAGVVATSIIIGVPLIVVLGLVSAESNVGVGELVEPDAVIISVASVICKTPVGVASGTCCLGRTAGWSGSLNLKNLL